jgi:curli production assembly/transport component CsgF
LGAVPTTASQLQYQPVNPNFGGNPLNSVFLFQQATTNNHFLTNPAANNLLNNSQDFNQQFRSALLSSLQSQRLTRNALPMDDRVISGG